MSRVADRNARKAELLQIVDAQRQELTNDTAAIAESVARIDGWLALARRMTPAAAVGLVGVTAIAGPVRVGRWLRTAVVPVLLIRQLLGRR
jgi:YqjK-like protein